MLQRAKRVLRRLVVEQSGLETLEYAIVTGLIVAATITVIAAIGVWVLQQFTIVQQAIGA